MSSEKQYIDLYAEAEEIICSGSMAFMNALRPKALEDFRQAGFPSKKNERYRYTDIDAAFAPDYGLNLKRLPFNVDPYQAYKCSIPQMGATLFYQVGDMLHAAPKAENSLPPEVYVGSFSTYAKKNPDFLSSHYGKLAPTSGDAITALNTLLAQDGLLIRIPDGITLDSPIQIVNLMTGDINLMTNRRTIIDMGKHSKASILFCHHVMGKGQYLTTHVAEVYQASDSQLNLYTIEETNEQNRLFENLHTLQADNSRLEYGDITLTCGMTRRKIDMALQGKGCSLNAVGAVVANDGQHIDNNLLIDHQNTHQNSEITYKYVLDGHSEGAFAGKVLVRQGAEKTNSNETNSNLCVSPTAKMHTQPMLEIYTDDVKCNHGSTVGQIDQAALFYMAQRGIPAEEASLLMQHAFVNEVIQKIKLAPLRERLSIMVESRFRHAAHNCTDCGICHNKAEKKHD